MIAVVEDADLLSAVAKVSSINLGIVSNSHKLIAKKPIVCEVAHPVIPETPRLLRTLTRHLVIQIRTAGLSALEPAYLLVQMVEQSSGIEYGKMPPTGA